MSAGMTFRRTCERCSGTFFTPDRKVSVCPKCVKRLGLRQGAPSSASRSPQHSSRAAAPQRVAPTGRGRASGPPTARTATLTEEIRAAVLSAYDPGGRHRGLADKVVNARLAAELNVKRCLVAEVLDGVRPPPPSQQAPEPEQAAEIIRRYQEFVLRNCRPPLGRHRTLAQALGLCLRQVSRVLREWRREDPDTLTRHDRFEIERAYWRQLQAGGSWQKVVRRVAKTTNQPFWSVARWLDQLLEDPKASAPAEALPEETRLAVEEAYREYLAEEAPPDCGLHEALATRFQLTTKQVYAVLLAYRLRHRPPAD